MKLTHKKLVNFMNFIFFAFLKSFSVDGLYYPYSENKGADQLRSYCAADLRLCFHICKKKNGFHNEAYYIIVKLGFTRVYMFSYFCSKT